MGKRSLQLPCDPYVLMDQKRGVLKTSTLLPQTSHDNRHARFRKCQYFIKNIEANEKITTNHVIKKQPIRMNNKVFRSIIQFIYFHQSLAVLIPALPDSVFLSPRSICIMLEPSLRYIKYKMPHSIHNESQYQSPRMAQGCQQKVLKMNLVKAIPNTK